MRLPSTRSAARAEASHQKGEGQNPPALISWGNLLRIIKSAPLFILRPKRHLPSTSFLRLATVDLSNQPKPETFTLSDGYDLAFRHYRAARDGRTAIVLIHGSAGHAGQFHALARELAANHQTDVYALDMRGHGPSALRRGHDVPDPDRLCADIREFLAVLKPRFPRLMLGGHSAGGGLVKRMIGSGIDPLVSGYVFFAPFLGLGSETIQPYFGGWVRLRLDLILSLFLANLLGIRRFNDKTVLSFDLSACPDSWRYAPSWSFNTLLGFGPDVWTSEPLPIAPDKPVLAVAGLNDQCFFPLAYPDAFASLAPQTEMRFVENCGHWDILMAPEMIGIVSRWLGEMQALQGSTQTTPAIKRSIL